jgi:DNA-binding response OmpR family regulator
MDDILLEKLKDINILCVEDEEGIRKVIVDTLKYYFNEVYEACDGEEAYELYEEYRPRIILSDIQMNNVNGVEFVRKIRETDRHTTIIMLTAHSNEEYLMDLINLNVNHFILKPLNLKKLNEALFKYINENLLDQIKLASNLFLDLHKRALVYKETDEIDLRKREKDFLHLLYENKNSIVTYSQIEEELWLDKEMTSHALKSFIKDLRAKLPVNIIKNISQEGYTLSEIE